jgi:acyl-coenzyme A thioesterase PaaI-like protein
MEPMKIFRRDLAITWCSRTLQKLKLELVEARPHSAMESVGGGEPRRLDGCAAACAMTLLDPCMGIALPQHSGAGDSLHTIETKAQFTRPIGRDRQIKSRSRCIREEDRHRGRQPVIAGLFTRARPLFTVPGSAGEKFYSAIGTNPQNLQRTLKTGSEEIQLVSRTDART